MELIYESYIAHHGVNGQRWGIRRYQDKNGNWTSAGLRRRRANATTGYDDEPIVTGRLIKRKGSSNSKSRTEQEDSKTETLEEKKQRVLNSRSATELYKHANLFTTEELRNAKTRLELERDIARLSPQKENKGREWMNNFTETTKSVTTLATQGIGLYNTIGRIVDAYSSAHPEYQMKPWTYVRNMPGGDAKK